MIRRVAIVTDDPGWHGAQLRDALAVRSCEAQNVLLRQCHFELGGTTPALRIPGFENTLPDGVFVRGVPGGTLEEIVFYLDVLHALRELGVRVYNDARIIERSVDKCMTSFLLNHAGISTPPVWVASSAARAQELVAREVSQGYELVFKPLFGSQGSGLRRISDGDALPNPQTAKGVYYLQRFIDTGEGVWHDWRVFVIGGRAVAAMRRNGKSWISNVATGARCQPAVLDDTLRTLAERAAQVLSMDYAGVDIIRDRNGQLWVVEVNSVPAWKGLQGVCNVPIAELLIDDFLHCCASSHGMEATG